MGKQTLSVVIITLNEADRIEECLKSVDFADQVVVADTGSEDNTCDIAVKVGAEVHKIPFKGFGVTKQETLKLATCEWVLSLDADEIITEDLRDEIIATINSPVALDGYTMPRRAWFLGKPVKYGGWHYSRILRLFRRDKGRFSQDSVHERVIVDGRTGHLQSFMEHYTDSTFPHYLAKLDRYSTLAADKIVAKRNYPATVLTAFIHSFAMFARMYILKSGWRDGFHGALLAVSSSYSTFLRYIKAGMMQHGKGDLFTSTVLIEKKKTSTDNNDDGV